MNDFKSGSQIWILVLTSILLSTLDSAGQNTAPGKGQVYNYNKKTELPLLGGLWALNFYGLYKLGEKPALDSAEVYALDKEDVWKFDRRVFNQSYPAPAGIYDVSDIGLWLSFISPALLFIDDNIRKDWVDVTLIYLESQAINYNLYVWPCVATSRVRPIVYYDEEENDFRFEKTTTDSFFSGHASMTAGASFFIAKVLNDYHPEWGSKRWMLFAAALIPPTFVSYCRYRGLLHFPTDILVGIGVGATVGTLVPHLHKVFDKTGNEMSLVPFTGRYSGFVFSMSF
jgi:hypothetical protein